MEILGGRDTLEYRNIERNLHNIMTRELINRAGKYKEFFEQNNEKPTRAFYKIGKTKNRDDNTRIIKDGRGESFTDEKARGNTLGNILGIYTRKK
jgi:hypothetical protein